MPSLCISGSVVVMTFVSVGEGGVKPSAEKRREGMIWGKVLRGVVENSPGDNKGEWTTEKVKINLDYGFSTHGW